MEDFNGLEPRLAALEQMAQQIQEEKAAQAQKAAVESLKDQYGMRFGNRDDVAMEILNQLSRQGVDVSAASSEAVQNILDDMQGQIAALYDAFNQHNQEMKSLQRDAASLADQLSTIDETVQSATAGDMAGGEVPGAPAPDTAAAPEAAPEPAPEAAPAPDAAPEAAPQQDPNIVPMPDTAPAPEAAAPQDPNIVQMPQEPQGMVVESDARVKNLAHSVVSDVRMKNISTENPPPKMGNNQTHFINPSNKVNVAVGPEVCSDERVKDIKKPSFGKHLISIASRGW